MTYRPGRTRRFYTYVVGYYQSSVPVQSGIACVNAHGVNALDALPPTMLHPFRYIDAYNKADAIRQFRETSGATIEEFRSKMGYAPASAPTEAPVLASTPDFAQDA